MQISEIKILSPDLDSTADFYNHKIGFKTIKRSRTSLTLQAGDSLIHFIKSDKKAVYHFAFNIPHNKLEEAMAWAKPKLELIPIEKATYVADFDNWNAKAFYFYDNNGNILEFLTRYDLPNVSDKKFDGNSILGLSEIAIVTDNVEKCAEEISRKYGIPYFSKQPPLPNFTVLGDDNGLLIISEAERHWYPTQISSQKFYTQIRIRQSAKTESLTFNTESLPPSQSSVQRIDP